jgi:hypothetical protein
MVILVPVLDMNSSIKEPRRSGWYLPSLRGGASVGSCQGASTNPPLLCTKECKRDAVPDDSQRECMNDAADAHFGMGLPSKANPHSCVAASAVVLATPTGLLVGVAGPALTLHVRHSRAMRGGLFRPSLYDGLVTIALRFREGLL